MDHLKNIPEKLAVTAEDYHADWMNKQTKEQN